MIAKKLHFGHLIHDHVNTSTAELGCNVMKVTAYFVSFKRALY